MRRIMATFACAAALTGCSHQATLTLHDGGSVDAEIVGSDPYYLYVKSDTHGPLMVHRGAVKDVDHPGNVAATLGTLGFAAGLMGVILGAAVTAECSEFCGVLPFFIIVPSASLTALSVPAAIWGYAAWGGSVSAAEGQPPPRLGAPRPAAIPPLGLSVAF